MIEGRKCFINDDDDVITCLNLDVLKTTEGRAFTLAELAERDKAMMVEGAKMAALSLDPGNPEGYLVRYGESYEDVARRIVEEIRG